jgi:hypothetical protein
MPSGDLADRASILWYLYICGCDTYSRALLCGFRAHRKGFLMFTEYQHGTLRALVNRIIPADDYPNGWDGGVGTYLERQFAHDLQPLIATYRGGLDALDAEARAVGGVGFADLAPAAQDTLLEAVEHGAVTTPWPIDPERFFRTVVTHAAEGYYSDPGNGGNHGGVAWQMVGFEVNA